MKIFNSWLKRIFLVGGVVLLLLFVMVLNNRMVHMVQMRGEMEAEQAKYDDLLAVFNELEREIEYAKSDDFVAEWARQQSMMRKDGDIVVVVIPEGEYVEPEVEKAEVVQPKYSNWEAWKLWLTYRE